MVEYNEQIKELEAELKKTKYNKATQGHIGLVKAKLAILKEKQDSRGAKKTGKSEHGYQVKRSGNATVILLGFPSTGKSTLLNAITDAKSEVGAYSFTTLTVIPGMMEHRQAKIQVLDVPGIVNGAASGRGRGREVLAVIRSADLVIVIVDVNHPEHYELIMAEARESGIRINKHKPEVFIKKTSQGGILIGKTVKIEVDDDTIRTILREFKINNADILIRSPINTDDLIDCIEGHKKYIPGIICLTKSDTVDEKTVEDIKYKLKADLAVSCETHTHLEKLKDLIYDRLDFIRIYMKEPKKEADMNIPLIITRKSTIQAVCEKTHKDFVSRFKFARVWGKSTKFPGQRLMLGHTLADGDILELHIK